MKTFTPMENDLIEKHFLVDGPKETQKIIIAAGGQDWSVGGLDAQAVKLGVKTRSSTPVDYAIPEFTGPWPKLPRAA
jgi:hypothetical protein